MKSNYLIKSSFLIFSVLIFFSCKKRNNQKVRADLTFRSISFASAYGSNKEQYNNLVKEIDSTLNDVKTKDTETTKLYRYFSKLREYDLLNSPYIFLHFGGDSIMTVYLSEKEYDKVKNIKHVDLRKENKKISIELEIEKKDLNIYYSDKIIEVFKINGKSQSNIYKKIN